MELGRTSASSSSSRERNSDSAISSRVGFRLEVLEGFPGCDVEDEVCSGSVGPVPWFVLEVSKFSVGEAEELQSQPILADLE